MLGEGEMFGHASLLSEWPTALAVRAAEDSLSTASAEAIRPVLARPAALRFAARSLAGRYEMRMRELDPLAIAVVDPARRPVSRLLRGDPVIAAPGTRCGGRPPHGRAQLIVASWSISTTASASSPTAICASGWWPPACRPTPRSHR